MRRAREAARGSTSEADIAAKVAALRRRAELQSVDEAIALTDAQLRGVGTPSR